MLTVVVKFIAYFREVVLSKKFSQKSESLTSPAACSHSRFRLMLTSSGNFGTFYTSEFYWISLHRQEIACVWLEISCSHLQPCFILPSAAFLMVEYWIKLVIIILGTVPSVYLF